MARKCAEPLASKSKNFKDFYAIVQAVCLPPFVGLYQYIRLPQSDQRKPNEFQSARNQNGDTPPKSNAACEKGAISPDSLTAQNLSRIRNTSTKSSSNTENKRIVYLSIYSQDLRELSGRDRIAMARLMAVHFDFALLFRNLARTHPNIFSLSTFKNFSAPLSLMR